MQSQTEERGTQRLYRRREREIEGREREEEEKRL